jgi:methanogenic corrinoid protein MtbC1
MSLEELRTAVVEGERTAAVAATRSALGEGVPARSILDDALVPATATVGDLFERWRVPAPGTNGGAVDAERRVRRTCP